MIILITSYFFLLAFDGLEAFDELEFFTGELSGDIDCERRLGLGE
jgi:hypothetical protein